MVEIDSSLVGGIGGALIGVAGTVLVYHLSKKKMKVVFEKTSISTMMNVHDKIKDKIKVEYEGKQIDNIYSFSVKIKNTGNVEVETLPLLFVFDSNTKILGINIKTAPSRGIGVEKKENEVESELKYEIDLLNPKDKIYFDIITTGNASEKLEVHAHVSGLNFYESNIITTKELMMELAKEYMLSTPFMPSVILQRLLQSK
jgi:hypothetical protein